MKVPIEVTVVSAPIISRLVYPELPNPVISADRQVLFTPSYDERKRAAAVARTSAAQVALLSQLKVSRYEQIEALR